MKRILFYCPSHKIGGEQLLYIRCANYLSEVHSIEVFYVDYNDGFVHTQQLSPTINIIDYKKGDIVSVPSNCLIVIGLNYICDIDKLFAYNETNRFLLWSLEPSNLTGLILVKNRYSLMLPSLKKKIKSALLKMICDDTIALMDYNNYSSLQKAFKLNLDHISYLPVPIVGECINKTSFVRQDNDSLSFMWISRIDEDKKNAVLTIMNEINEVSKQFNCKLFIVGDGNAMEKVKQYSSRFEYDIIFLGRLMGNELNSFIDEKVDIGIAMGTSILEIAKRGKPVIVKGLMPRIYQSGELDDYIFLNEEYGFSLGAPEFPNQGQSSFEKKVDIILSDYSSYAKADYEYVVKNHSIHATCDKLLDIMRKDSSSTNFKPQHENIRELVEMIRFHRKMTFRKN